MPNHTSQFNTGCPIGLGGLKGLALRLEPGSPISPSFDSGRGRWSVTFDGPYPHGGKHTYFGRTLQGAVRDANTWIDEGCPS